MIAKFDWKKLLENLLPNSDLVQMTFQGKDYLFLGEPGIEGAITTPHAYRHGLMSHAHLYPNGEIRQFGEVIGSVEDIVWGEEIKVEIADDAFENMETWRPE